MAAPAGPALQLPSLRECETASFDWSSTAGPFKAWIWTGTGGVGTILKDFGVLQTSQVAWTVDLARGHTVQLAISDAAGQTINSQPSLILPGNCPPGFPLRSLNGDKPDSPSSSSTNDPPVSQASPSRAAATSVKAADVPAPTPTFSAVPSKALDPGSSYSVFSAEPIPTSSGSPGPNMDSSIRAAAAPSAAAFSTISSAMASASVISSALSSTAISTFTGPIPTPSSRPSGTLSSHTPDSAFSSSTSASLQSDVASAGSGSKISATAIAGIVGGVLCGLLLFGLIFYLFCRLRHVKQDPFDDSGQDFVHFTDSASSSSLPPIYARYRSESSYNVSSGSEMGGNMAGRGAGGGSGNDHVDLEKKGVNEVNNQTTGLGPINPDPSSSPSTSTSVSVSVYDMTPRPILDPAILGRSAKSKPPRIRPPTASTWRSSFGALVSRLGPLSPSPGPGSAFRLGRRGSSTVGTISGTATGSRKDEEADEAEMLTSGGLSRNGTITQAQTHTQTQMQMQMEKPPSYRASISTFANHTLQTPTLDTNTENNTSNSDSRTLLPLPTPRRKSDATTRSRRSVATFGADFGITPDLPSPSFSGGTGLLSPNGTAHSPGSEDSFGDILDSSELAYAQPSPAPDPGLINSRSVLALSAIQPMALPVLPPLAHLTEPSTSFANTTTLTTTTTAITTRAGPSSYTSRGVYNHPHEGVVSRVSIGRYERPRTLTLTRDSFASFATEVNGSNLSVNTISAGREQGGSGSTSTSGVIAGQAGGKKEGDTAAAGKGKDKSVGSEDTESALRFSGKWSGWRRSFRLSNTAQTDDYVGHAI